MGTDIHLYVERRDASGHWQCVPPPRRDDYLDRYPRLTENGYTSPFWGPGGCFYEGPCSQCGGYTPLAEPQPGPGCVACLQTGRSLHWYGSRNYDVFAILADVRNGYGFAGCPTGKGFHIIDAPRGVPDDVSDVLAEWNTWDHTPSWLRLDEVLAFDWDQTTTHYGVIPLQATDAWDGERDTYEVWRPLGGRPTMYCGAIHGPGVRTVTPDEADALLDAVTPTAPEGKTYVRVSWTESYRDCASEFLACVQEFMLPLGDPTTIRLVFGFDS